MPCGNHQSKKSLCSTSDLVLNDEKTDSQWRSENISYWRLQPGFNMPISLLHLIAGNQVAMDTGEKGLGYGTLFQMCNAVKSLSCHCRAVDDSCFLPVAKNTAASFSEFTLFFNINLKGHKAACKTNSNIMYRCFRSSKWFSAFSIFLWNSARWISEPLSCHAIHYVSVSRWCWTLHVTSLCGYTGATVLLPWKLKRQSCGATQTERSAQRCLTQFRPWEIWIILQKKKYGWDFLLILSWARKQPSYHQWKI